MISTLWRIRGCARAGRLLGAAALLVLFGGGARAQEGVATKSGPDLWSKRIERIDASSKRSLPRGSRSARLGQRIRRESFFRYQRLGGPDGVDRVLTVRGDGTVKLVEGGRTTKSARLEPHVLKQVARLIKKKGGFKKLRKVYGEKTDDPFQATTTLVAHVAKAARRTSRGRTVGGAGGRTSTVTVYESPEEPVAPEVGRILEGLQELVEKRLTTRPEMPVEFHGIASSGMIDRHVYRVVKNESPEVPSLWLHISVVNFTDEPLVLRFATGQAYEITIRNLQGDEIYRWSEGRSFSGEPEEVRLQSDWLSYVERIPLGDAEGRPYPPGEYVLSYEVLSDPPFRGETTFVVEAVEPLAHKESLKGILARHRAAMKREKEKEKKEAGSTKPGAGKTGAKAGKGGKGGKGRAKGGKGGGKRKHKKKK